jgi:hypothetical protein
MVSTATDIDQSQLIQVLPKMENIRVMAVNLIPLMEYMRVNSHDCPMSSVTIKASYDAKNEWTYGIIENSNYFTFQISPAKDLRYYEGGKVKVKLLSRSHVVASFKKKFRAKTTTPEDAIALIKEWILSPRIN